MCTAAEPASHGHDAGAGAARTGRKTKASTPEPAATAYVSSSLSAEALTSVFHVACRSAAPSTAAAIGSVSSTRASADDLVEQRAHALDRSATLFDRLLRTVVVHGGEVGQERRDEHVGRVARKAAPRDAHLHHVERGAEHLEDRRDHGAVFDPGFFIDPARPQPGEPSGHLARRDGPAAVAVGPE